MRAKLSGVVLLGILGTAAAHSLSAQVTVAPTVVTVSPRARFGSYVVLNRTDSDQEVIVDFRFGYPVPTAEGSTVMFYDSSTPAVKYSATSWVRAYPKRFILKGGQRQMVRLLVTPPANLEPAAYWTRIVTTSAPLSPPIDTLSPNVRAQITVRIEQVTTLLFRQGALTTGVQIGDVDVRLDTAQIRVQPALERTGNAPFLGTVVARLFGPDGKPAAETTLMLGVYFEARPILVLQRGTLPPGDYTLEVTARPDRGDIPPEDLFPGTPASRRVPVALR